MQVTLTIIRYPRFSLIFSFLAMALHRLPLVVNKNICFYKLMGCGKNGTFDIKPDLRQWVLMAAHKDLTEGGSLYGLFIQSWWHFFNCEVYTLFLEPLEGRGLWDNKQVFGELPLKSGYEGAVATLTRATIRINKLKYFQENVAPVSDKMNAANGFIMSVGMGEIPLIKQATFSIWNSVADMKSFAYQMTAHKEVIRKTREQQWYSEEMFVRFRVTAHTGTLRGSDPLHGKL